MKTITLFPTLVKPCAFLIIVLIISLSPSSVWAKNTESDAGQSGTNLAIDKNTLKVKIDAINSREGIDDITKSKLLSIYQAAEDNLG
ncbi:MAG: hypothetical protein Q7U38_02740, partial [Methylobacter sp.]|nr:hypothetical protein [Methylobacter sp.]